MTAVAEQAITITSEDEAEAIARCRAVLTRTHPHPGRPGYMCVLTALVFLRAALDAYDRTPGHAGDRSLAVLAAEVEADMVVRVIRANYGDNAAEYVAEGD